MERMQRADSSAEPVSWYEYYTNGSTITEGLVADGDHFTLNALEFQVSECCLVHPLVDRKHITNRQQTC